MNKDSMHYLQKELQTKFQEDLSLFEFIQNETSDGIWYRDLENPDHEWISEQFWHALGRNPSNHQHRTSDWMNLVHPEDLETAKRHVEQYTNGASETDDLLIRFRHLDGSTVWMHGRGGVINDAKGNSTRTLVTFTNVTGLMDHEPFLEELKSTKSEIISSDEKFRKTIEAAPLAMLKVDGNGSIIFANKSALDLFGYEPHELLNQDVEILIPEEHHHRHTHNRKEFVKNPGNRRMAEGRDLYGLHKNGSLISLEIGLTPLQFTRDHQTLVTIHDISVKKRFEKLQAQLDAERETRINDSECQRIAAVNLANDAEKARLRAEEVEQRLEKVASHLGIIEPDTIASDEKYSLRSFFLKEMINCGNQIRSLANPQRSFNDIAMEIVRFFSENFVHSSNENEFPCVRFFRTKSFSQLSYEQKCFLRSDYAKPNPDDICLVHCASTGTFSDESDPKDPCARYGDLDNHFAMPLSGKENKPIPVLNVLLDQIYKDTQSTDVNLDAQQWHIVHDYPGYVSIISTDPENDSFIASNEPTIGFAGKLIGDHYFLMIAKSSINISLETFALISHLKPSIKLALLPFYDHTEATIEQINTVHYILQRKQELVIHQESKLRETMNQLQRSNEELDQFAYIASHDLQAPLHGITNLADFLIEDLHDSIPENSKRDLELLKNRTSRLKKLLQDLLEYARVGHQNPKFERISLHDTIQYDVVDLFEVPDTFVIQVPEDLPVVKAPRTVMELIFRNLIGNAIKHHDRQDGRIEITFSMQHGYYELGVKDDGPGIDSKYHEQAFKVFQTLKPRDQVEGSGMGLAMVEKTIGHYGGKITLDSSEGHGAHFKFTWPKWSD